MVSSSKFIGKFYERIRISMCMKFLFFHFQCGLFLWKKEAISSWPVKDAQDGFQNSTVVGHKRRLYIVTFPPPFLPP